MRTPWHLWAVGLLTLLWNAGGAADYVMTKTENAAYLAELTPEQLAFMAAYPTWFTIPWAVGVWAAVLGSVLLLVRSRYAATFFLLSLAGLIVAAIYSYVLADPSALQVMGTFAGIFTLVIFAVLVLSWLYARAMTRKGVLR